MTNRRLFVCDPACVQEIGHNVHALRYFKAAFTDRFDQIYALCGNALPDHVAEAEGFIKHYALYYPESFPGVDSKYSVLDGHQMLANVVDDSKEIIATRDALSFLRQYEIGRDDAIFFPHLDFYGVVGLLNALEALNTQERPRLFLRFIGVMENATDQYPLPANELLFRLRAAGVRGTRYRVSAETPRYADLLAEVLEVPVAVTGYPLTEQPLPMSTEGPFYFYCPGSARGDKGYFELRDIFAAVRSRDPECRIRFVTQSLPKHELHRHLNYTAQLYALPGVELQTGLISAEKMIETYRRTHAVLLPYARDVYEFRGSAVLMEAAAYGRPAIAYEGAAFSDIVRYFGLGQVVNNQEEMVSAILKIGHSDRATLNVRATQAGWRFHADNSRSYETWLCNDV